MKNNSNDHKITKDDLEKIKHLPIVSFQFGNVEKSGHYDQESKMFYHLDSRGELTGYFSRVNNPDEEKQEDKQEPMTIDEKDFQEKPSGIRHKAADLLRSVAKGKSEKKDEQSEGTVDNKHMKKILSVVLIVFCAIFLIGYVGNMFSSSGTSSGEQTAQDEAGNELDTIVVVQVTRDMIPGEVITSDDIQESKISAESYNEITLGDSKLYQWDRADSLIDKYVISYIPQGQYLTYDNIGSVYTPPANPWLEQMDGYETVSIPIPDEIVGNESLNYGAIVDLSITKRTVNEANLGTNEDKQNAEGITHDSSVEQSYIIDKYSLQTTICDLLNDQGDSLYNTFCAWLAIPAGEQSSYLKNQFVEDQELSAEIEPKYITIKVTPDQAKELGEILSDDSEVVFSFTNTNNEDTVEKADFIAEIKALFKTIGQAETEAKTIIESEAADDEEGE